MTDEMLALAQRNAAEAGATNVEFLKGHIEAIPLPADSIDVVISNCVVNLAADKPSVFREIARVLRPGGRIGISDIVAEDRLSPAERFERGSYAGCIAGALSVTEFREGLAAVGMTDISITPTHDVADGILSAIIAATNDPGGGREAIAAPLANSPAARLAAGPCPRRAANTAGLPPGRYQRMDPTRGKWPLSPPRARYDSRRARKRLSGGTTRSRRGR